MQFTKSEVEQILSEVTKEYEELVKSEQAEKLVKAEVPPMAKEESTEKTEKSKEATKPETSKAEDSMPEASADKDMTKAEGDAPEMAAKDVAPEVAAEVPAEEIGANMGPEELLALYSGLNPEQLAQHWMAASQALFQEMQSGEAQSPVEEMAAPAPDVPPTAPDMAPPMAKSEPKDSEEFKSLEKNYADLKTQNSLLEKSLEQLSDKLKTVLKMPVNLGVTPETAFSKAEEPVKQLSKSEVVERLKEKAKDTTMSEADKKKLVSYSMNPVVTTELKDFLGIK